MKICSVEKCTREVCAKGMCQPHYRRTRNYGSPTAGPTFRSTEVCSAVGCDRPGHAIGYCKKHYQRHLKYGNADAPPRKSMADTLAGKLAEGTPTGLPDTECWEWTKYQRAGYGSIYYGSKSIGAHRVAYEIYSGAKIPKGLVVRHRCDNPPCVNPSHLELGTSADNVRDMLERGRGRVPPPQRGERHGRARLTADAVLRIRNLHAEGVACASLAREFGVSTSSIHGIVRRKTWKHI